jgi:hypothetical protein
MIFRYGATFLQHLPLFSSAELRVVRRHCRELIEAYIAQTPRGEGWGGAHLSVELYGCDFVLSFDPAAGEWILHVANMAPDKKARKPRSDRGKRLPKQGEGSGAMAARTGLPRRKQVKPN